MNGADADAADFVNGHIVVPATPTRAGANQIEIEFIAATTRSIATTSFSTRCSFPRARSWRFPCFDQPDLKARYRLRSRCPDGWQAVANGASRQADTARPSESGATEVEFAETPAAADVSLRVRGGKVLD